MSDLSLDSDMTIVIQQMCLSSHRKTLVNKYRTVFLCVPSFSSLSKTYPPSPGCFCSTIAILLYALIYLLHHSHKQPSLGMITYITHYLKE